MSKKIFGGDFEFHFSQKGDGKIICAEELLTISKSAQIAAETTTAEIRPSASNNIDGFIEECRDMIYTLSKKNEDLELICCPVNRICEDYLYSMVVDLYEKDTDYYSDTYLPLIQRTLILPDNYRTQGGHFWIEPSTNQIETLVTFLDLFVALPMVILFPNLNEAERRIKYGKAGNYRTRNSLLEYRVLSSSVMTHPEVLKNVLKMIQSVNIHFLNISFVYMRNKVELDKIINEARLAININSLQCAVIAWNKVVSIFNSFSGSYDFSKSLSQWKSFILYMHSELHRKNELKFNFLRNWFIS